MECVWVLVQIFKLNFFSPVIDILGNQRPVYVLDFYFGKTSLEAILNDGVAIEAYGGGAND